MVKRQLSEKEKELSRKGIDNNLKKVEEIKHLLEIKEAEREMIDAKRKFNDLVLPIQRREEDSRFVDDVKQFETEMKIAQETINTLQDQIMNGVEPKGGNDESKD